MKNDGQVKLRANIAKALEEDGVSQHDAEVKATQTMLNLRQVPPGTEVDIHAGKTVIRVKTR